MSWGEQFPEGREREAQCLHKGVLIPSSNFGSKGDSFTHKPSWRPKEPTWSAPSSVICLLEDLGGLLTAPSLHQCALGKTQLFPQMMGRNAFQQLPFYFQIPSVTNVTSLIVFFFPILSLFWWLIYAKYLSEGINCECTCKIWGQERVLPSAEQRDDVSQKKTLTSCVHTPGLTNISFLGHSER